MCVTLTVPDRNITTGGAHFEVTKAARPLNAKHIRPGELGLKNKQTENAKDTQRGTENRK